MDAFTQRLFECVLAERRKKGQYNPDLQHVIREAWDLLGQLRDVQIARWAKRTLDNVPHEHLVAITDSVIDELARRNIHFTENGPDEDNDIVAECTAWDIACLRWFNRETQGYAPVLIYDKNELAAWLERRRSYQLSLF